MIWVDRIALGGMALCVLMLIKCIINMVLIEYRHRQYLKSRIDEAVCMKHLDWMDEHLTDCGY